LKGKESKTAVKIAFIFSMKNNIFMEKIEVEIFVTKFFSSEFDLKLQAVDATLQTIFFIIL